MNLQSNNYYILASSQLFPFSFNDETIVTQNVLLQLAHSAYQLVNQKKYTAAIDMYSKVISTFSDHPFFYACRSIMHRFNGDDESSFYDYQIAKRLDFNYHHYLEWLENQGDMIESDELLELNKMLSKKEDSAQLYINRALLQVQHFNYAEAICDYSKAFELTNNLTILVSRAAIYMRVLQYDRAFADLNLVVKNMVSLDAYLYRAKMYIAIKEYDAALHDFEMAISIDNQNTSIYEERGQLYEKLENYNDAIADYSTMIDINKADFFSYVLRADAYEKIENYNLAIADYSEAIRLNPYYSDLYQYRGDLLERIGKKDDALNDFKRFEELEDEE